MTKKSAEKSFVRLVNLYRWDWRRYGDVKKATCMSCRKQIQTCPLCNEPLLLPKTEQVPDYALAPINTWVECKNSDSTGRWNWAADIGPNGARIGQRNWLNERNGWLFIELGDKPAPNGKSAYMVPWGKWVKVIEPLLLEKEMKSIRKEAKRGRPGADELLAKYRLEWQPHAGWIIPGKHIVWEALYGASMALYTRCEEELHGISTLPEA